LLVNTLYFSLFFALVGDALGNCEALDVPANCEAAFEVGA
jgi:hypothetical protein